MSTDSEGDKVQARRADTDPTSMARQRSYSFSHSNPFKPGIPLGTITAQLASKSFWTGSMLQERLKQIAHTVLHETSSETSSNMEAGVEIKALNFNEDTKETQKVQLKEERELRTPCSSQGDSSHSSHGYRTPPFLSPGITRRIRWMEEFIL